MTSVKDALRRAETTGVKKVLALAGLLVLAVGQAGPAAASEAAPPLPEGSGYACEVTSWAGRTASCVHTSWGVRWGPAPHGTHLLGDVEASTGWKVWVREEPDTRLLGTWCDQGADFIPACTAERQGQGAVPDGERFAQESDHLTAYPAGVPEFPDDHLAKDQWLLSPDGHHGLVFQADGNLVSYGPGGQVLWSSGTYGNPGAGFVLQDDGNAVIYAPDGTALWSSGTWGDAGDTLVAQDDGNVVIYRADGTAAFWTGWGG